MEKCVLIFETMAKKRARRKRIVRGFSLVWSSKNNSSRRTVAAANLMESTMHSVPTKNQRRRAHMKSRKINNLCELKNAESKMMTPEAADGVFFPFEPDLELFKEDKGAVHWIDKAAGVFSVIKTPKKCVLDRVSKKNTATVVGALKDMQTTEEGVKRSSRKTGTSDASARHTIFGNKVHQGRHGFVTDKISKLFKRSASVLSGHAKRMEDLAAECVPSHWLRAIAKANGFNSWPTVGKCKFVAAMASSIDCSAPAHTDEDFLFSIHQVNVDGHLDNSEAVQHFCFPTCGFAVGLRPGDVLLFNPHVHHCLSAKSLVCDNVEVHVTTFCVKTAHVGGNDNRVKLTNEQELNHNMQFGN